MTKKKRSKGASQEAVIGDDAEQLVPESLRSATPPPDQESRGLEHKGSP